MANGPVQYSGITTGEDGQLANRDIERIISQKLEKEKKITDLRFDRIESNIHGLKNDLGKHILYFEEILGLLMKKSPAAQTSGHNSVPISEKQRQTGRLWKWIVGKGRHATSLQFSNASIDRDERLIYSPLSKCDKNGTIL